MNVKFNCLIAGTGGQGSSFISRVIGEAALARGLDVCGSDSSGRPRRGCAVVSHLRLGQNIYSPLIPQGKVHVIIALDPAEAVRYHSFLSAAGRMLVLDRAASGGEDYNSAEMLEFLNTYMSRPSTERYSRKYEGRWFEIIDTGSLIEKCGGSGLLNPALLGVAAVKNFIPLSPEDILAALAKQLPADALDANIRAFNAGRELAG